MSRSESKTSPAVWRGRIAVYGRFIAVACLALVLLACGCASRESIPTEPRDLAEGLVDAVLASDLERVESLTIEPLTQSEVDTLREAWTGSVQPSVATTMTLEFAGSTGEIEVYTLMRVRTDSGLDRQLDAENHGIELWLAEGVWKVSRVW